MSFGIPSGALPGRMSSQHVFSQVPKANIPRSTFDRSHGVKTAFDSGYLVPIYADEALPGDTFSLKISTFARLATLIKPVMDNLYLDLFFFFVPNRLVWANFQKFCGAQANPGDSTTYLVPQTVSPASGPAVGSLADYLGVPTLGQITGGGTVTYNSLHHRAYNLIWNEWFRDQNLQNSVTVDTGDGADTYANYVLLRRGKRHDYFTSCLPWPQKGTAVTLPLGTQAPVKGLYTSSGVTQAIGGTQPVGSASAASQSIASAGTMWAASLSAAGTAAATAFNGTNANVYADLNAATAATINQLRQSFQIQKLYERDARGGTRYTEIVRSHFGVISPDARLQRPEYLGGGSTKINVYPIPQTSATGLTGGSTAAGSLAAMATQSASGIGFHKSFTEHGVLLGLASIRADLSYQQGLNRMFTRQTRNDFYWPAFSHIGEQAVLNQEIYCEGSAGADDAGVFGYQERYAEYRFKPSMITGIFRSTAASTLDLWHLAQKFTSVPTLGDTFIKETPPISRVVAVNTDPQILFDALISLKCARPMPVYSVPGMIDRF